MDDDKNRPDTGIDHAYEFLFRNADSQSYPDKSQMQREEHSASV